MNSPDKVDFNMSAEDKKLALEYDDMNNQIKDLTIKLRKQRTSLKSTRVKASEEENIIKEINETENYIKNRIFARNKISSKLYGSEVKKDVQNI
jgi:hypothetical protein